jgi:hypothetical protein
MLRHDQDETTSIVGDPESDLQITRQEITTTGTCIGANGFPYDPVLLISGSEEGTPPWDPLHPAFK